jgi:hypothetical protein
MTEWQPAACLDCGLDYEQFPLDVVLADAQWRAIHPDGGGLLCAACIAKRAARLPDTIIGAEAETDRRSKKATMSYAVHLLDKCANQLAAVLNDDDQARRDRPGDASSSSPPRGRPE